MIKEDFIATLKEFGDEIADVRKTCAATPGDQIQSKAVLTGIENLASRWFDQIEPPLKTAFVIDKDVIQQFRSPFRKLLELVGGRPTKRVVLRILDSIQESYRGAIIVSVQGSPIVQVKFPTIGRVLEHVSGIEVEYLTEAIECAQLDKKRAAIILGWCAAANRLHLYVEREGFDKFNAASAAMCGITTGRYKRYQAKFEVHNLTELRMVASDNNLLWVLEYMEAIDGNQHERLGICLTMRDSCAHPGETIITDDNLPSFFSDIDTLILNSPKFKVA